MPHNRLLLIIGVTFMVLQVYSILADYYPAINCNWLMALVTVIISHDETYSDSGQLKQLVAIQQNI